MYRGYHQAAKPRNRRSRREDRQLVQGIVIVAALAIVAGMLILTGVLHF